MGPEDYKRFKKEISKIDKIIEKNTCNNYKDIGDKVIVWDGSYSEDLETGQQYGTYHEVFKEPVILIEKNCKNIEKSSGFNRDIVVYSLKYNKKIATSMDLIRLVK